MYRPEVEDLIQYAACGRIMQIRGLRGDPDAYDALVDSVCLEIADLLVDRLGFDCQSAQAQLDRGYVKSVMDRFA